MADNWVRIQGESITMSKHFALTKNNRDFLVTLPVWKDVLTNISRLLRKEVEAIYYDERQGKLSALDVTEVLSYVAFTLPADENQIALAFTELIKELVREWSWE